MRNSALSGTYMFKKYIIKNVIVRFRLFSRTLQNGYKGGWVGGGDGVGKPGLLGYIHMCHPTGIQENEDSIRLVGMCMVMK